MTVEIETCGAVRVLRLNRPETLNALDDSMINGLAHALESVEADPECGAVVLTGAGRAFCAGLDLKAVALEEITADATAALGIQWRYSAVIKGIYNFPLPVVAAINGPTVGAGFALAMACDIRVAGPTATMATKFIRLGLAGAELGLSWLLPRAIGHSRALELTATGRTIDAEEALTIGLVDAVHEAEKLESNAVDLAGRISSHGRVPSSLTKRTLRLQREIPSLEAAMELENRTQALMLIGGSFRDEVAAFRR